jgi:predicted ABC-type ATPase
MPPKHWFIQEPDGVASQKTTLLILTAVKTSGFTVGFLFRLSNRNDVRLVHFHKRVAICGHCLQLPS